MIFVSAASHINEIYKVSTAIFHGRWLSQKRVKFKNVALTSCLALLMCLACGSYARMWVHCTVCGWSSTPSSVVSLEWVSECQWEGGRWKVVRG